jgi:hypothetical protein
MPVLSCRVTTPLPTMHTPFGASSMSSLGSTVRSISMWISAPTSILLSLRNRKAPEADKSRVCASSCSWLPPGELPFLPHLR